MASFQEGISSSIREDTESEQIINEDTPYAVEASPDIPHNHVKKQQIIDEDISSTNSSKWYVDWQNAKCVQSCDSPTIVSCGGIVTSIHTELYDSAINCCSTKFGWISSAECQADSTNSILATHGTNQWYVKHSLNKCVRDCTGSTPSCGGFASSAGMRCIVHQVNVARESYGGLMLQVADWNDVIYNIVSHCANQMDCKYIA